MPYSKWIVPHSQILKPIVSQDAAVSFIRSVQAGFSEHFNMKKIGVHFVKLPAQSRLSFPHAESLEEEFLYILKGYPDLWINGEITTLEPGLAVGFPAGTGIAHTLINNTESEIELIVAGERTKNDNLCSFPINPELKTVTPIYWENYPPQKLGTHKGLPGPVSHKQPWRNFSFITDSKAEKHDDSFNYPNDPETFTNGLRLTDKIEMKALGIWHEILPAGKRSSWPHAHKLEEEFCYIISGEAQIWMNGFLYDAKEGDGVFFSPGTNIAHTILNNTQKPLVYLMLGESHFKGDQLYYPHHEKRNTDLKAKGELWEDRPWVKDMGTHSGIPGR